MPIRPPARKRRSAHERRAEILRVAIPAFAEHGYAACTAAIAERAGISHPYLFRLFPTKKQLFLACHDAVALRTRDVLEHAAAAPGAPEVRLRRMARALTIELSAAERRLPLHLLSASGDPELWAAARIGLGSLLSDAARLSGAEPKAVARFCGDLMLGTAADLLALDDHPVMRRAGR